MQIYPEIAFVFERGGELEAEVLPELAPRTVACILKLLPIEAILYHTRWCG
ncbi:MAG: DUF3830 family protein, partial [Clostridia bacterium]|nr:DUF3830 family protein [Clostridia bacterium]